MRFNVASVVLASCVFGSAVAQADDLSVLARAFSPALAALEVTTGLRGWFSSEQIRYSFYNRGPRAGNPSSTLDWTGVGGRSAEATLRLEHIPGGVFVKALGGLGGIGHGGRLLDRDFSAGQVSFSATSSDVDGDGLDYAVVDVGVEYRPFAWAPGLTLSPFAGYQRWNDNPTAQGVLCAPSDVPRTDCLQSPTGVLYPGDVKALSYASRWDALRVGLGASVPVLAGFTLRGEVAWVPYAHYAVDDSHYLRQDPDPHLGLGPVPNVFIRGAGRGIEAEAFLDYAVTSSFTLGIGGRYWELSAQSGTVHNGVSATLNPVTVYDQKRYGLLVEAQYKF